MKNIYRKLDKFNNKFNKAVKEINIKQKDFYNNYFDKQTFIACTNNKMTFICSSATNYKKTKREEIVKTLINIDYKRKNNSWNSATIIGFMTEAIKFSMDQAFYIDSLIDGSIMNMPFELESKAYKQCLNNLCNRYNVPKNRINTQIALFIMNAEKGHDKANLLEYFDYIELVKWKYRDIEKLQTDIEKDKVDELSLQILKDLEIIE